MMKKSHNKFSDDVSDDALRSLLKENVRQAPPSPWFTRKVMNRLPEKRLRTVAWLEYAVYLIAALVTIVYSIFYGLNVWHSGVVTVENIGVLAICFGLFCSISYLMIEPWLTEEAPVR